MKKQVLIAIIILKTILLSGQLSISVTTPGGFREALKLKGGNPRTVTNLVVTGSINASDIFYMRDSMPVLAVLDISAVTIQSYSSYPANELPEYSFENKGVGKTSLTEIILPNTITSIGFGALENCKGLTTLKIPGSVKYIYNQAFDGCSGLTGTLTIPASVTSIGKYVFSGCNNLENIKVDEANPSYLDMDGILFDKNKTGLIKCSATKVLDSYSIPETVKYIADDAFSYCSGLTGTLTIPNSVVSIGNYAFYSCSGLRGTLTIPNSVVTIGYGAFHYCSGFTGELVIPNSVKTIWDGAFSGCSGFTGTLTLPSSLTEIKEYSFQDMTGLTGIVIPNTVTSIEEYAFSGCTKLEGTLTIPGSVTSIGNYAFSGCKGFEKIFVDNTTPPDIEVNSFYGINKTTCELRVPKNSVSDFESMSYWSYFTNIREVISVLFKSEGNDFLTRSLLDKSIIEEPTIPNRTGYTFDGWYKEEDCLTKWYFAIDTVLSDTSLYAKWLVNSYTVNFESNGGSTVSDIVADYNTTITIPDNPIKTGFVFKGWYKESNFVTKWNFSDDLITSDTILYARWIIKPNLTHEFSTPDVNLFPNPCIDRLNIRLPSEILPASVYILSTDGKELMHANIAHSAFLDISSLIPGIYIVRIQAEKVTVEKKILKF